jgi:murein DD-endopeptidase MepM/ murein hydrolase activator NlpD
MKSYDKKGFSRIILTLALPFIILVIAYGAYKLFFIPDPVITGLDQFKILSSNKTITLNTANIKSLEIAVYQNDNKIDLLNDLPELSEKIYKLNIKPKSIGLTDGQALIIVKAKAGLLKEVKHKIATTIDTVPPVLEVLKAPRQINRGSSGAALLRAKGADSVFIKLVDPAQPEEYKKFKAYELSSALDVLDESSREYGMKSDKTTNAKANRKPLKYLAFFPAPYDIAENSLLYAVASDVAGNINIKSLSTRINLKDFKKSSINIDDNFINRVVYPLLNETSMDDPVGSFKRANEDLRDKSVETIMKLAQSSDPRLLWQGRFSQLKNSKVMAKYGDERTYLYKGNKISKSAHLGYDLASYTKAPVEAANSGIVKFAADLSIYGSTVIIDHGLGLMSLYGHLSALTVEKGDRVKRGDMIGKTGATGLAGGDHLHFGIMLHGYEVSPVYWWDRNWIKIHILDYLTY